MEDVQLNTLYVVTEGAYLHRDGQTIVVEIDKRPVLRLPIHMIDSIACFGRVMVSPQLMEFCAEQDVALNFLTPNGRLMARVDAPASATVKLRRRQYKLAEEGAFRLEFSRCIVAGKLQNARYNLLRSAREIGDGESGEALRRAAALLAASIEAADKAGSVEEVRGIEGDAARVYFEHFALMTPDAPEALRFRTRSRQPPLDPINALLSLCYSILTHDCVAALVAAGLDPSVGFFHEDHPGRPGLALDLVEEFRAPMADRFVITLINRRQVTVDDFVTRPGGAVELKEPARKRLIGAYQERKQERRQHPYLEQEAPWGRFVLLQARILASYVRGSVKHYVPVVIK